MRTDMYSSMEKTGSSITSDPDKDTTTTSSVGPGETTLSTPTVADGKPPLSTPTVADGKTPVGESQGVDGGSISNKPPSEDHNAKSSDNRTATTATTKASDETQ
ncbi:hypothetical protein U1Q18_052290, partial [Sarracenia purpurea var. burkii]